MDGSRLWRLLRVVAWCGAALEIAACGGEQSADKRTAATPSAAPTDAGQAPRSTIAVTEDEYSIAVASAVGRRGRVTFEVRNAGAIKHEFVVIKTSKRADALLKGDEADETGAKGEIEDIDAGTTKTLRLTLTPGHYALVCNLPGHYMPGGKPGMLADFTVH
jgi:uncharacterized cupredoxin-like copper-binding protein